MSLDISRYLNPKLPYYQLEQCYHKLEHELNKIRSYQCDQRGKFLIIKMVLQVKILHNFHHSYLRFLNLCKIPFEAFVLRLKGLKRYLIGTKMWLLGQMKRFGIRAIRRFGFGGESRGNNNGKIWNKNANFGKISKKEIMMKKLVFILQEKIKKLARKSQNGVMNNAGGVIKDSTIGNDNFIRNDNKNDLKMSKNDKNYRAKLEKKSLFVDNFSNSQTPFREYLHPPPLSPPPPQTQAISIPYDYPDLDDVDLLSEAGLKNVTNNYITHLQQNLDEKNSNPEKKKSNEIQIIQNLRLAKSEPKKNTPNLPTPPIPHLNQPTQLNQLNQPSKPLSPHSPPLAPSMNINSYQSTHIRPQYPLFHRKTDLTISDLKNFPKLNYFPKNNQKNEKIGPYQIIKTPNETFVVAPKRVYHQTPQGVADNPNSTQNLIRNIAREANFVENDRRNQNLHYQFVKIPIDVFKNMLEDSRRQVGPVLFNLTEDFQDRVYHLHKSNTTAKIRAKLKKINPVKETGWGGGNLEGDNLGVGEIEKIDKFWGGQNALSSSLPLNTDSILQQNAHRFNNGNIIGVSALDDIDSDDNLLKLPNFSNFVDQNNLNNLNNLSNPLKNTPHFSSNLPNYQDLFKSSQDVKKPLSGPQIPKNIPNQAEIDISITREALFLQLLSSSLQTKPTPATIQARTDIEKHLKKIAKNIAQSGIKTTAREFFLYAFSTFKMPSLKKFIVSLKRQSQQQNPSKFPSESFHTHKSLSPLFIKRKIVYSVHQRGQAAVAKFKSEKKRKYLAEKLRQRGALSISGSNALNRVSLFGGPTHEERVRVKSLSKPTTYQMVRRMLWTLRNKVRPKGSKLLNKLQKQPICAKKTLSIYKKSKSRRIKQNKVNSRHVSVSSPHNLFKFDTKNGLTITAPAQFSQTRSISLNANPEIAPIEPKRLSKSIHPRFRSRSRAELRYLSKQGSKKSNLGYLLRPNNGNLLNGLVSGDDDVIHGLVHGFPRVGNGMGGQDEVSGVLGVSDLLKRSTKQVKLLDISSSIEGSESAARTAGNNLEKEVGKYVKKDRVEQIVVKKKGELKGILKKLGMDGKNEDKMTKNVTFSKKIQIALVLKVDSNAVGKSHKIKNVEKNEENNQNETQLASKKRSKRQKIRLGKYLNPKIPIKPYIRLKKSPTKPIRTKYNQLLSTFLRHQSFRQKKLQFCAAHSSQTTALTRPSFKLLMVNPQTHQTKVIVPHITTHRGGYHRFVVPTLIFDKKTQKTGRLSPRLYIDPYSRVQIAVDHISGIIIDPRIDVIVFNQMHCALQHQAWKNQQKSAQIVQNANISNGMTLRRKEKRVKLGGNDHGDEQRQKDDTKRDKKAISAAKIQEIEDLLNKHGDITPPERYRPDTWPLSQGDLQILLQNEKLSLKNQFTLLQYQNLLFQYENPGKIAVLSSSVPLRRQNIPQKRVLDGILKIVPKKIQKKGAKKNDKRNNKNPFEVFYLDYLGINRFQQRSIDNAPVVTPYSGPASQVHQNMAPNAAAQSEGNFGNNKTNFGAFPANKKNRNKVLIQDSFEGSIIKSSTRPRNKSRIPATVHEE